MKLLSPSSSRLRRGQMKEASEMKYGDQVEGVCKPRKLSVNCVRFNYDKVSN